MNGKQYVGSSEAFATWALHNFSYMDNSHSLVYDKLAKDSYRKMINNSKTRKYVSMSFNFQGMDHQVVYELFHDIAPRTCENFIALCNNHARSDGVNLSYVGTEVHRIV